MKILFVCHRFPFPPSRGGKIRPFNVIRRLSQSHEVTVASLARSSAEAEEGRGLAEHCRDYLVEVIPEPAAIARMVARLPSATPSSMGFFYSPALARRIAEKLRETRFDLIFVHCSSVAQYVEDVAGIPKLLDFGDMDSQKWLIYSKVKKFPLSMGYLLEGTKLRRAEMALARKFDFCTCTTEAEHQTLKDYGVATPSDWFPNGVDLDKFAPDDGAYDADTISFIGRMDYYPNQKAMLDFCADVLPRIRARRPDARLVIVGAEPSAAIRNLARQPGVTVTGTVPDVRPLVRGSAVNVAPLTIARGTQNKILEALAMGVPVVSSSEAAKGIDAVPGEHFLTADTPDQYAHAILALLEDATRRRHLAEAGRRRMETNHSWAASLHKMERLVAECVALRPPAETSEIEPGLSSIVEKRTAGNLAP